MGKIDASVINIRVKYFSGLNLCGPENTAIIRIRVMTISMSLIWPVIIFAFGATPSVFTFIHGIESKSLYDYTKTNRAFLLSFVIPMASFIANVAVKIYSDQLHRQMANSDAVFVIFGAKTETAVNQEEKFPFPLGPVVGFPALVLMTFLTSFASRDLRLLLFSPIQIALITFALPCFIVRNNSKIKRRAFRLISDIKESLMTQWHRFKKLISSKVVPKVVVFESGQNQMRSINL